MDAVALDQGGGHHRLGPIGYMLITLDAFVDIVDLMGGVEFDVPMDMFSYEDSSQDLFIEPERRQAKHLDGCAAMGLARSRKGYADQVSGPGGRCGGQFLIRLHGSVADLPNPGKAPSDSSPPYASSESSLTTGNLPVDCLHCLDAIRSLQVALAERRPPLLAMPIHAGTAFPTTLLDPEGVADAINRCCNPLHPES
ncbi:MAG: LCP family protein [Oscillospiraceae bacterium]